MPANDGGNLFISDEESYNNTARLCSLLIQNTSVCRSFMALALLISVDVWLDVSIRSKSPPTRMTETADLYVGLPALKRYQSA